MASTANGINYTTELLPNDVLFGRGSGPNEHEGNIRFRRMVAERKEQYLGTNHRITKANIAREIVDAVFAVNGRFLKKMDANEHKLCGISEDIEAYVIADENTIMEKAKQALRQNPQKPKKGDGTNPQIAKTMPGVSSYRDDLEPLPVSSAYSYNRQQQQQEMFHTNQHQQQYSAINAPMANPQLAPVRRNNPSGILPEGDAGVNGGGESQVKELSDYFGRMRTKEDDNVGPRSPRSKMIASTDTMGTIEIQPASIAEMSMNSLGSSTFSLFKDNNERAFKGNEHALGEQGEKNSEKNTESNQYPLQQPDQSPSTYTPYLKEPTPADGSGSPRHTDIGPPSPPGADAMSTMRLNSEDFASSTLPPLSFSDLVGAETNSDQMPRPLGLIRDEPYDFNVGSLGKSSMSVLDAAFSSNNMSSPSNASDDQQQQQQQSPYSNTS